MIMLRASNRAARPPLTRGDYRGVDSSDSKLTPLNPPLVRGEVLLDTLRNETTGIYGFWFKILAFTALTVVAAATGLAQVAASSQADKPVQTTQAAEPVQTTQPVEPAESVASEITAETIQARIAQIENATDLPEIVRTEVVGLYKQAQEQITSAENWVIQIAKYEDGCKQAPVLLEAVKQRIDQLTTRPATEPSPEVPSDANLEQLSAKLSQAESELKVYQDEAKKLDDEAKTRLHRKNLIPDLSSDAKKRLEKIATDLGTPPASGTTPQQAQARRTLLTTQKRAVEQEIKAYEGEFRFYDTRNDLLAARRDEAKRLVVNAQARVAAWETVVSERRKAELERQRREAELELRRTPRAVRELAEENSKLIAEREEIDAQIDALEAQTKTVKDLSDRLAREFDFLQQNIDQTETADLGPLMRKSGAELAVLSRYEADLRLLKKKQAQVRLRAWELEEKWLVPVEKQVGEVLDSLRESGELPEVSRIEPKVRELLESRRASVEQSMKFFGTYEARLRELVAAEDALVAKVREFSDFVKKHVLWIRSTGPIHTVVFPRNWPVLSKAFKALMPGLLSDLRNHIPAYIIAALTLGVLIAYQPTLRRRLHDISPRVARPYSDSYGLTIAAFVHTFLLSLPWAILMWFAAKRISTAVETIDRAAYDLGQAIASGLRSASLLTFVMEFTRNICRPKGLGETHFRWNTSAIRHVRKNVFWLMMVVVPTVFLVSATERYSEGIWRDSVGRFAFILNLVALLVCAQRLLRPGGSLVTKQFRKYKSGWAYHLRYLWYVAAITVPIALTGAAVFGYHYSAVALVKQFQYTVLLILALILVHAMMVRWLLVAQRKLALEQIRKKRLAAMEEKTGEKPASAEPVDLDDVKLDIGSIGEQTKTLLRSAAVLVTLIGLWTIWRDMLPALGFMEEVKLWAYAVETPQAPAGNEGVAGTASNIKYITLAHVAVAIIIAVATVIFAKNIPGLLEITVLQKLPLDMGGRYAFTALVRYVITLVGIIIAFGAIGIGWSKVQWLVAAITVGLGFGLQEIFANFVSGLMLLFERPIRVGDIITVGDMSGTVSRIRIRATTITCWDRKELVIPNKEFITSQVINWTLSDLILRIILPVGIAYGSDTQLARKVLYQIAKGYPNVLNDPEPRVLFMGFGDSSLNFELRVYIASVDHYLQTMDELNNAIDQEFRKAGIEIAFPQRDIHLRSIKEALPIISQDPSRQQVPNRPEQKVIDE